MDDEIRRTWRLRREKCGRSSRRRMVGSSFFGRGGARASPVPVPRLALVCARACARAAERTNDLTGLGSLGGGWPKTGGDGASNPRLSNLRQASGILRASNYSVLPYDKTRGEKGRRSTGRHGRWARRDGARGIAAYS